MLVPGRHGTSLIVCSTCRGAPAATLGAHVGHLNTSQPGADGEQRSRTAIASEPRAASGRDEPSPTDPPRNAAISATRAAGTDLVAAIRVIADDPRYAAIAVETMACFWSCAAGISVHLRAPGKIGYVLGRFGPDPDAARALLDFALAYDATSDGEVRFDRWPAGVLGHFIARVPPAGMLTA